jgi:hypothetical protein
VNSEGEGSQNLVLSWLRRAVVPSVRFGSTAVESTAEFGRLGRVVRGPLRRQHRAN